MFNTFFDLNQSFLLVTQWFMQEKPVFRFIFVFLHLYGTN